MNNPSKNDIGKLVSTPVGLGKIVGSKSRDKNGYKKACRFNVLILFNGKKIKLWAEEMKRL